MYSTLDVTYVLLQLYNVVVDTEETGKSLLQKGQLKRRYTIIPLNKIVSRTIPHDKEKKAIALVRCPLLACVHIRGGVHNESTGQYGKDLQFPKLKTCNHGVICCFPSEANVIGLAVLCTNVHDIRIMCYVYILYVQVEYICTCILTVNYVRIMGWALQLLAGLQASICIGML